MTKDTGGSAFPRLNLKLEKNLLLILHQAIEAGEEIGEYAQDEGMTLWDYFAACAIDSVCDIVVDDSIASPEYIAKRCYNIADALIAERGKRWIKR